MNKENHIKALVKFVSLELKEKNLNTFFDILFTDSEIEKIYDRIKILDCLDQGLSQRETLKKVGGGISTISRGAHLLKMENFKTIAKQIKTAKLQNWWQHLFWCK